MSYNPDLLIVNPGNRSSAYGKLASSMAGIEPPLWCGLTAAFIRRHGYSVKIIDADGENLSPQETARQIAGYNPLLVNIAVMGINPSASSTPKMDSVSKLLRDLRNISPETKTVLSGIHPSALPKKTLKEEKTDFIARGEVFFTLLNTLKFLKKGKFPHNVKGLWYIKDEEPVDNGWGEMLHNLNELPRTAWDLLPMDKYRAHNWHCFDNLSERSPYASIYTGLGCPFNCSYCNVNTIYSARPGIRYRPPEKILEEIEFLVKNYNIKNLKIADELFVLNEKRVHRICDLIIEKGYDLNMWAYGRTDTVNKTLLKKMKEAGINWICYGIESGSSHVREKVLKKIGEEKIEEAVNMAKDAGIYVLGNFLFGLPDDNMETMKETLKLAKKLNCEYANFYTVMAYPGSELYKQSLEKKVKLPESWSAYGQLSEDALPLPTEYLSAGEVLTFRDRAFHEYYSNPCYLEMMEQKFGSPVAEHIRSLLKHRLKRKHAL